jgi:hypothetical protein
LKTSFGETKKVFLYINLTNIIYNMRPTTPPRNRSWDPLHHAPTSSTHSYPLHLSLGKWQGFAMEEEGILAQTHNVVAKYWDKGGILKWAEFLGSRASLWNGTPTLIL